MSRRVLRDICRAGEQSNGSTGTSTAWASNPRLIFRPHTCDRHQSSTSPIRHASGRVTMAVMRELGCLQLCTMFTFQRSSVFPPNLHRQSVFVRRGQFLERTPDQLDRRNLKGPLLDHLSHGPALGSDLYSVRHRDRHRHQLRAIRSATISPARGPVGRRAFPVPRPHGFNKE